MKQNMARQHLTLLFLAVLSAMVTGSTHANHALRRTDDEKESRILKGKRNNKKDSDSICLNDAAVWRSCVGNGQVEKGGKGGKGKMISAATTLPTTRKKYTLHVEDVVVTLGANIEESLQDGCDCRMDVEDAIIRYLSNVFDSKDNYNFLCAAISSFSTAGGTTTTLSTSLTFQVSKNFTENFEDDLSDCTVDALVVCCLENSIAGLSLPGPTSCADLACDLTLCQVPSKIPDLQRKLNDRLQSCEGVGGGDPVFLALEDIATLPPAVAPTDPTTAPPATGESPATVGPSTPLQTQMPSSSGPTTPLQSQVPTTSGPTTPVPTTNGPTSPLQNQVPTSPPEEVEEEEPDPSVEIPIPTDEEGTLLFDTSSFEVFVEPSFATIEFVNSSLFYAPEWAGIKYDAFGIQGLTPHGDTFFLTVEYNGIAKTVDCKLDFLGQVVDFVWGQEVFDEDDFRRWLQTKRKRTPPVPVDWHHELPRGIFANKDPSRGYNIDGIDRDFINRKEYGAILLTEDHIRGIHSPKNGVRYNDQWKNWIENFKMENGGALPNKKQVLGQLENFRQEYKPILDKGIRNHNFDYDQWGREKRNVRNSIRRQLEKRIKESARDLLTKKQRAASKLIAKKGFKAIPGVGTIASVFFFIADVAAGRPFWEAFIDNAQDAIPFWGTARGLYEIGGTLIELFDGEIVIDDNKLEEMLWDFFVELFGLGDDDNDNDNDDDDDDDGSGNKNAGGTSDPHFTGWNRRFSYQGECDLVFVQNNLITVHVRTTFGDSQRRFSFISNVAFEIEKDVVEIFSNRTYYVNGVQPSEPPATLGRLYPFAVTSSNFQLDLFGGQQVRVSFYRSTITLDISGHSSDFGTSVGFAGSFSQPKLLGRDGVMEFNLTDLDAFADEWNVHGDHGDSILFLEEPQKKKCRPAKSFTSSTDSVAEAVVECRALVDEISRQNCIFDILASNETGWSENPAFTNPFTAAPPQCEARNNACSKIGGNCVWRCDTSEFTCVPGKMCVGTSSSMVTNDDECSCAIPITASPSISHAPTSSPMPSLAPSSRPSLSGASLNQVITCISVIDESLSGPGTERLEREWTQFRGDYPERPFCLLQPGPNQPSELLIPAAFLEDDKVIFSAVSRDGGDQASTSDWFDVCNLDGLRSQGIVNVAIFIDNSGSLTTAQVQASFDLFVQRLEEEGLTLVEGIENSEEDWIAPFLKDFGLGGN